MTENLKPTSARDYRRKKQPFLVTVSPNLTVLMKPLQMEDSIFSNLIPMPAASAQAKIAELESKLNGLTVASVLSDPSQMNEVLEDKDVNMLDFLRRFACAAVIEPVIVMEDDGNDDHIPVTELTRFELMRIFNAEPTSQEPPLVAPERVEEFRGSEPEQNDSVPHARKNVRPEAELVDLGDREVVSA